MDLELQDSKEIEEKQKDLEKKLIELEQRIKELENWKKTHIHERVYGGFSNE